MSEKIWKRLTLLFWGNVLIVSFACSAVNVYVYYVMKSQEAAIAEKKANLEVLRDQLLESERTLITLEEFEKRWSSEDRQVQEMMASSTSRDDFIVRQGARIAWHQLAKNSPQSKSIGLYLPAGGHRLCFATRTWTRETSPKTVRNYSSTDGYSSRDHFLNLHPRRLKNPTKWELGSAAEIYEIVLETTDQGMRIYVLGSENKIIHEATFDKVADPAPLWIKSPKIRLAYPSELQLPDGVWLTKLPRSERIRPVTEFATGMADSPGQADIRIWIESNAQPCLPASHVASSISVNRRHGVYTKDPHLTLSEVQRYFLPYDGSETMRISDGFFTY